MRFLLGYVMQWSFLHAWLFRCYASELVGSCRCVHHGCCCCCSLNRFQQWTITADISSRLTSCCVLVFSCYILLRFLHSSFSVQRCKHRALLLASCNQVAELAILFFSFRLQKQRPLTFSHINIILSCVHFPNFGWYNCLSSMHYQDVAMKIKRRLALLSHKKIKYLQQISKI